MARTIKSSHDDIVCTVCCGVCRREIHVAVNWWTIQLKLHEHRNIYQTDLTERTFNLTLLMSPSENSTTSTSGSRGKICAVIVDSP